MSLFALLSKLTTFLPNRGGTNSTESGANQQAAATGGGSAVNMQGDHDAVRLDDPQVGLLLAELLKRQQAVGEGRKRDNEELQRLLARAVRTIVAASRELDARPAAKDAVAGLEKGDVERATDLLATLEHAVAHRVQHGEIGAGEGRLDAASLAMQQGALLYGQDARAALSAFERAARNDPSDVWTPVYIGDMQTTLGNPDAALKAYRQAASLLEALLALAPGNSACQRDLAVCHERIGDVLLGQGDAAGALTAFQTRLDLVEVLLALDPENTGWQHDLAVSHERIGDLLLKEGDEAGALAAFRSSLTLRAALLAHDPANTWSQRCLALSHERIADVLLQQGDGAGALTACRASLAHIERLVALDPEDTGWPHDLALSHIRIGDVLHQQGEGAGALAAYRQALSLLEGLLDRDPENIDFQHDLAVARARTDWIKQELDKLPT